MKAEEVKTFSPYKAHLERLLTMEDLVKMLSISKAAIYKMVYKKRIPYTKIGKLLRFREREIMVWIESKSYKQQATNPVAYKARNDRKSSAGYLQLGHIDNIILQAKKEVSKS